MENKLVNHFYLKKAKVDKAGKAPVYLRLTLNGERVEMSVHKKIKPDMWDKSAERISGRSEYARTINAYLTNLRNKIDICFIKLDNIGERLSVQQLVNELSGKSENQITLVEAFEKHNKLVETKVGIDYSAITLKRYRSSLNSLKEFMEARYNKLDIKLGDLKHEFIVDYETYLKTERNLKHNSSTKSIKNLYRVINMSVTNGWLNLNPFRNFSCNYRENYRECLNQEEIDILFQKEFSIKRLEKVRDVFIFQIYTGFSYGDVEKLTPDNIQTGIDGEKWITIYRGKTGGRSSIPLLPRAIEVINKYKDDPGCLVKGKLLPVTSNQKMNGYLKEIADICDIKKNLTTHLARHTFATTITLTNGVPIETVSKMLGHKSLRTTQIYSKVVDTKISIDMQKLKQKIKDHHNTKKTG